MPRKSETREAIEAMPDLNWLTPPEMAERLQVSESYLKQDRQRREPKVPFVRFGRSVRYPVQRSE